MRRVSYTFASLIFVCCAPAYGQQLPIRVEPLGTSGQAGANAIVEASAGASVTLVFRLTNPSSAARQATTGLELPQTWQVLFASEHLELPAAGSVVETIALAPPPDAAAGEYRITYRVRTSPDEDPVVSIVAVRVAARRKLAVAWVDRPAYAPAGSMLTLELSVTNQGNVTEQVVLDVQSRLGAVLTRSWKGGALAPGESRRVRVARDADEPDRSERETLKATARAEPAITADATVGFLIVPEGQARSAPRARLPVAVAARAGTNRPPGFGSVVGGGPVSLDGKTNLSFGFLAAEQSHPLMFERDRNYVDISSPRLTMAFGDQTWSLSTLTESGHYGTGAGGTFTGTRWSGGGFVDTGRHDVVEGGQAGAFVGLALGRSTLSAQYLRRFAETSLPNSIGEMTSLRLAVKPFPRVSGSAEVAAGRSPSGVGGAIAGQLSYNTQRLSIAGRRVSRDDSYPIRDRTGLLNSVTLAVRPIGRLQIRGSMDGTEQVENRSLPLNAPTRQRSSRATASWGSLARVSVGRTEWTSPGRDWDGAWRRESANAEVRLPFGPLWISPGAEQGTQVTPKMPLTEYQIGWVGGGVRLPGNNSFTLRAEISRGLSGRADEVSRRLSVNAALRPTRWTSVSLQVQNSAIESLWSLGVRSVTGIVEQDLPWRHRVLFRYQALTGAGFGLPDERAFRTEYVVPFGVPLRAASDGGRVTVRMRDADTGQAQAAMLLQIDDQTRLTDADGVAMFTGLKAGDYDVTAGSNSLGPGRIVMPALPFRVSVKAGSRVDVNAAVVRTARINGRLQLFQTTSAFGLTPLDNAVPGAGIIGALLDLTVGDEHRTVISDAQGRFFFDNLPPGASTLRVVRANVPTFFRLEQSEVLVTLGPGDTRDVVLRAVPKEGATFELTDVAPIQVVQRPESQRPTLTVLPDVAAPQAALSAPVTPRLAPPAVRAAASTPAVSGYVVQVAAVRDETSAEALRTRLSKKGYPTFVEAHGEVYRVRVGVYAARGAAVAVSTRLAVDERVTPWVAKFSSADGDRPQP